MKIQGFIHAQWNEWDKEYHFQVWGHDMSSQESCGPLVETVVIEFTAPPREVLVNGTIEGYRKQQQKIRAEGERLVNELQQRINDLLCIENKSEAA